MNQKIDNILNIYGIRKNNSFPKSKDMDNVYAYHFLSRLLTPFAEWPACTTGAIDESGNILIPRKNMNYQQLNSFTKFDHIVLKTKKMIEKSPNGHLFKRMPTQTIVTMLLKESEIPTNVAGPAIAQKDILLKSAIRRRKKPNGDQERGRNSKIS